MLELICEKIGVEIGEKWLGNDGFKYKINKDGMLIMCYQGNDGNEALEVSNDSWVEILMGELKPMWIPKKGDWYCFPEVAYSIKYGVGIWRDDKGDKKRLKRGIVFKTKDEAIECANKMIDAIK